MVTRLPQSRAERLIAVGRLVLALASLWAIYLDPLEPALFPALTYTMLAAYAVYALLVLVWTLIARETSSRWQVVSHLIDLTFFGTINHMTFGPTSPFFIYFIFSMLCAMLRFGRPGTIATAAAALIVFIASSFGRIEAAEFELNRFLIRGAYLFVVASMLVYLAAYQERIQRDLSRIARWPRATSPGHRELIENLMRETAEIFDVRRLLFAYEHLSERFAYLGQWEGDVFVAEPQSRETANLLLDRITGTYISRGGGQTAPIDFDDSVSIQRRKPERSPKELPEQLVKRYEIASVVSTSFKGDFVNGRILLLDGNLPLLEEVNLARIVGGVIAGRLDHFHSAKQLERGAVAEERVRVGRDLHDSVLQLLTGVALQLHTLRKLMLRSPEEAQERVTEIEQVIVRGQKELRWFIDSLRPEGKVKGDGAGALEDRLSSLAESFRSQWSLDVENRVAPLVHLLPPSMRLEIYALVNEAVANAAKHAGASRVDVAVDVDDRHVRIAIADNGRGFPFRGHYDLATLISSRRGPVTLKERVAALGGSMVIDSSEEGAKLEMRVPLNAAML